MSAAKIVQSSSWGAQSRRSLVLQFGAAQEQPNENDRSLENCMDRTAIADDSFCPCPNKFRLLPILSGRAVRGNSRVRRIRRSFSFPISAQQTELKAAYAKAEESAQRIRQTLRDNGIDPKNAEIGYFSMTPTYTYPKRKIVGYQVSSHVTIKVHDFGKLAPIIESFSQAETTDSLSVSYTLENIEAAKAKAVEDAYCKTHDNAEALARAGGRMLGVMTYASVDATEFVPQPRPMRHHQSLFVAQSLDRLKSAARFAG